MDLNFEKLILLVQEHGELYNAQDINYRDVFVSKNLWESIGKAVGVSGFYWHLRDKSRSWTERTKLLRYAWKYETVLLPNKYQTLLDLLIFGLNDQKRWSALDVQCLWCCLCEVLQTPQCQSASQHTLVLKSAALQIFQDGLNQSVECIKTHGKYTETSDVIISCCLYALISPSLNSVFTGKTDILIGQLSTVLSLANSLHSLRGTSGADKTTGSHLCQLLTTLVDKCLQVIRQRPQPQQTLSCLTGKLLEPSILFLHEKNAGVDVQQKLKEVLRTALFHRELLAHYEHYSRIKILQTVAKFPKSTSKLPKFIEHVFLKLEGLLKGAEGLRDCTMLYLTDFYSGFLESYRDAEPGLPFQLLKLIIVNILEIPMALQVTENCVIEPTLLTLSQLEVRLKVIVELLAAVQKFDVYDLGKDDEGSQLKWFKALASWILSLETRCDSWYSALDALLRLDHTILEPKLTVLLTKTITHGKESSCDEQEVFLTHLVDLFTRLRQMSKFMSRLIHVLKEAQGILDLPPQFQKSLMICVSEMPVTLVYDVWGMFITQISPTQFSSGVCELFAQFLLHIELSDYNMGRVTELSVNLWQQEVIPLLEAATTTQDEVNLKAVLSLLYSFGELQILLSYYHPQCTQLMREHLFHNEKLVHNPHHITGLTYTYSKVPENVWKYCKKAAEIDPEIYFIWMKLEVQQLKAVMLFEDVPRNPQLTVALEKMKNNLFNIVHGKQANNVLYKQMKSVLVNHVHLLTNQSEEGYSRLCPLIVAGLEEQRALENCRHVQEARCYHMIILENVSRELDRLGTETLAESPRKKRRIQKAPGRSSLAEMFTSLNRHPGATRSDTDLTGSDLVPLLATLKNQSCLPFEHLSPDCAELCVRNLFKVLQLLQDHPVKARSDQLELVQTCYTQLAATLPNFLLSKGSESGLTKLDVVAFLSFFLEFHGKVSQQNSQLDKLYEHIMMICLRMLLKSDDGLTSLKQFVDKVKVDCNYYFEEKYRCQNSTVLITLEILLRCLTKMTTKHFLPSEVTSLSLQYLEELSAVALSLAEELLRQPEMKWDHCRILGGAGVLIIQACKSEQVDPNITHLLHPLYTFCVKQLENTKQVLAVAVSCVEFVCRLSRHHTRLHTHLTPLFVQEVWDTLSHLAANYTRHTTKHCCQHYTRTGTLAPNRSLLESPIQTKQFEAHSSPKHDNDSVEYVTLSKSGDVSKNSQVVSMEIAEDTGVVAGSAEEDLALLMSHIEKGLLCVVGLAEDEMFLHILQGLTEQLDLCGASGDSNRAILSSLRLWSSLVSSQLTHTQWTLLAHLIQKIVIKLQHLVSSPVQSATVSVELIVEVLSLLAKVISQGQILLSAQSVMAGLHSCIATPLLRQDLSVCCYTALHKAVYSVLNEMLLHHPHVVSNSVPAYLAAVKLLITSFIARGDQGDQFAQKAQSLLPAAHRVDRLLTLIASHKEDFSRVATYIIADYVNEVQKVTLVPELKKVVLPGVYSLLSLCDNHAIAQLYTVLSPGLRQIFKTLHQEYIKYFKYTGKV